MDEKCVGLLGATSLVGECLIPLLQGDGWRIIAFSRRAPEREADDIEWRQLGETPSPLPLNMKIRHWICLAPVWALPDYFGMLKTCGARRVVALSSTSRFTKADSSDSGDHAMALRLTEGEDRLRAWAEQNGIEWVILRPTLIYGRGRDKNLSEIARFIRRFGFFPLFGRAMGLRQPVHAEDVAAACAAALLAPLATHHAYNLSGGETLPYRDMVARVFAALNRRPRLPAVPLFVFRFALACLRLAPRYRRWSSAMAERMNQDMAFDHAGAASDLGFSPRTLRLAPEDLP